MQNIPKEYQKIVEKSQAKYPRKKWTLEEIKTIWLCWENGVNKRDLCINLHRDYRIVKRVYETLDSIYQAKQSALTDEDFKVALEEVL